MIVERFFYNSRSNRGGCCYYTGDHMPIYKYCTKCENLMLYNGKSLCNSCANERQKKYNKYQRDEKADKFYHSVKWKRLSLMVLARAGYKCAECGGLACEVHHIKDIRSNWELRFDIDNLMPLCTACHNAKRQG